MKSSLSFLIDLALELVSDKELPTTLKTKYVAKVSARIREEEKNYSVTPQATVPRGTKPIPASQAPIVAVQSPSMQALMAQNPDLIPKPPVPVTAVAAKALADRQALILGAANEKPGEGRKSPRKF